MIDKRVVAIYLPQYHPFEENDKWWGKGFTEWTNVTKAKPKFPGHYQPHLPSDLGFYDLRIPEIREQQAQMAKDAGIYGFCYYHYWFNGRLLMERPLKEVLESGSPDFPFMICWANENWTRAWDGGEKHILISQNYSEHDAIEHIKWMIPYLKDKRYIKIDGKPVIAIYRSTIIPNIERMLEIWRTEAKKKGINLYICRFESFGQTGEEYQKPGFDASIDFQPHFMHRDEFYKQPRYIIREQINKIFNKVFSYKLLPDIVSYKKYVEYVISKPIVKYKCYPCVTPSWDNSARRKGNNFFAFSKNSPYLYGKWLKHIVKSFKPFSKDENLIFINAWNEWAEGNHLEPDIKWKNGFLEETRKAIKE